jgi:hypothetical protein
MKDEEDDNIIRKKRRVNPKTNQQSNDEGFEYSNF